MLSPSPRKLPLCAIIGLFIVQGTMARADAVEDFYKGKTVTLIVSADAGTGYDLSARAIARYLPNHLAGAPNVTVENMASAGGLSATNYLYNVAPKDGLNIGLIQATVPFEPFYENKQAHFDPTEFNWLGTPGQETSTLMIWHTVPVETLADAKTRGLTLSATGGASTPAFYGRLIRALMGVPIKLIVGYKSQNESTLAMERGENEGNPGIFLSSIKAQHPDWLANKTVKLLLQYGNVPNPEIVDVPFALDLISNADDKRAMEVASAPLALGRPILAPPGVPVERVAALRKALVDTFRDPAYLADCAQQNLTCDKPVSSKEVTDVIAGTYSTPVLIRKRLVEIYGTVQ